MKIMIKTTEPVEHERMYKAMLAAGLQDVSVINLIDGRLQMTCRDNQFSQLIAALAHDGRVKAAVICSRDISGWIEAFTVRTAM